VAFAEAAERVGVWGGSPVVVVVVVEVEVEGRLAGGRAAVVWVGEAVVQVVVVLGGMVVVYRFRGASGDAGRGAAAGSWRPARRSWWRWR